MKSSITIKGKFEENQKIKIYKDGSAETIVKIKNQNYHQFSIAVLKISANLYKKHKARLEIKECSHKFTGQCRIAVNSKGIPYLIVDVKEITKYQKHKDKLCGKVKESDVKEVEEIVTVKDKIPHQWYKRIKEEDYVEIDTDKICLVEDIHKKFKSVYGIYEDIECKLAVRELEDGQYALVTGLRGYIIAKIFNKKTCKCYITDLAHNDFAEKYGIVKPTPIDTKEKMSNNSEAGTKNTVPFEVKPSPIDTTDE